MSLLRGTSVPQTALYEPLTFQRGLPMKNRFMLAPMTNQQSGEDGVLSSDELHWLRMRAQGGFAHIVTCACHVEERGKGFPGELGIFSDRHVLGLRYVADVLRANNCRSSVQLYHGGLRAIAADRISPSGHEASGARAMTRTDIEELIEAFVAAAVRAETAGFDGVELHAAHGYLISQFLSAQFNQRCDEFGDSAQGRSRLLFRIIDGIRAAVGSEFQLGVRLSPERFGQDLVEIRAVVQRLIEECTVDFIDLSLWDAFKQPEDPRYAGRSLLSYFTEIDRGPVRLGVAGKIIEPSSANACIAAGVDFVTLGKVAVLHHDYPKRLQVDDAFQPDWLPVRTERLRREGLGERFIAYLATWTNFVCDYPVANDAPRFDIGEYLTTGTSGKKVQ
ncbi:MAG: NADH:flavin oxidoreductase [Steroidobacteraceae bacterium]